MRKFNNDPGSDHTQDVSPDDTLTSWSLDDFLDNVPWATPLKNRGSIDELGEFLPR